MTGIMVYGLGLTLLALLGVLIGRRLPVEYRTSLRPSLLMIAMVWAFLAVHFSLVVVAALESAWRFSLPQTLALSAGLLLIAVGSTVYLSAAAAFRSLKRMNFMDATRLVTDGIYRWSRNPQAVGWMLVLLGLGLARRSGMVLVLAAVCWLSFRLSLPLEEELLRRLYGEAYGTYERHTHRYFGAPRDLARGKYDAA